MESLLLNACNKQSYEDHFKILKASCYSADLDWDSHSHQLHLCADLISQELPTVKKVTSVRTICDAMNSNRVYKTMLSQIHKLLRLYLTIPFMSATSERSFSGLKRVFTYVRSTMTEQRLNNCLIMYTHKHLTDIKSIAKEFIAASEERRLHFGPFNVD